MASRPVHQIGAVVEHLPEQRARFRPRILAELACCQVTQPGVRGERGRLLPAPVERQHELDVRMLRQRVRGEARPDLGQDLMMLTKRKARVDQPFPYVAALLKQRVRRELHQRRIRQVDQGRIAPQAARLSEQTGSVLGAATVERGTAMRSQALED